MTEQTHREKLTMLAHGHSESAQGRVNSLDKALWTLDNIYTVARRETQKEQAQKDPSARWLGVLRLCEALGCQPRDVLKDNGGPLATPAAPQAEPPHDRCVHKVFRQCSLSAGHAGDCLPHGDIEAQAEPPAERREPLPDDTGLTLDMLDADKLRALAHAIRRDYQNLKATASWLEFLAGNLECAIRDIGMLRQAAGLGGEE